MDIANDVERLHWTYEELKRIERSRTDELQNQQLRVATVLVANTFILGLVANEALGNKTVSWEIGFELASVVVLAVAVLFGIVALWPGQPLRPSRRGPLPGRSRPPPHRRHQRRRLGPRRAAPRTEPRGCAREPRGADQQGHAEELRGPLEPALGKAEIGRRRLGGHTGLEQVKRAEPE
jgi:hypothetical protein